jgi:glycosyltransferase involved in cell wall biosynthesis
MTPARSSSGGAIRIAFVIDELTPGAGTENQLLLLLSRFDPARLRPYLCCLRGEIEKLRSITGVPVVDLSMHRLASPRAALSLLGFRRWLRRERIDGVVTFFLDGNLVGTLAGFLAGLPVISSRRNIGYWHSPWQLRKLRALNAITDWHLANSEAARRYTVEAEGVDPRRVRVIPNAVDLERFHPANGDFGREEARQSELPPGDPLIGCVANLRPVKGQDVLLRAFAAVAAELPAARLVLIGDGPERAALASLAASLAVGERVTFLGSRDDVPRLLRRLDVGVLSSRSESFSNTLLEYLATGLPVVATSAGGSAELPLDSGCARLVPPDDPDSLARALLEVSRARGSRPEWAGEARRFVESRYSPRTIVEHWHRFLEGTVVRGGGNG